MNFISKISPVWALRLALGVMYLYSGIDLIRHPTAWVWALPYWLRQAITAAVPLNTYLQFQGTVEIVFAIILLGWFIKPVAVKWVALLSTLEFAVILILAFFPWSEANFSITFRDIGLFGAALTLFALLSKRETETSLS